MLASSYGFRELLTYESTIAQCSPSDSMSCLDRDWSVEDRKREAWSVKDHHTSATNLTELWTALANIWKVIQVERFQKLVESMPRRVADFMRTRGDPTRYLGNIRIELWMFYDELKNARDSRTAKAGSDVVQSGRPIFDDFLQHLWPYIGNNTANVVFQMGKRLWLIHIDQ
ncbi:hypothetical protein TNCV_1911121 [Trichonephila clavipes]|nr:hypothetical protein TNCV_1911121 [Trichonephila clavipes]